MKANPASLRIFLFYGKIGGAGIYPIFRYKFPMSGFVGWYARNSKTLLDCGFDIIRVLNRSQIIIPTRWIYDPVWISSGVGRECSIDYNGKDFCTLAVFYQNR